MRLSRTLAALVALCFTITAAVAVAAPSSAAPEAREAPRGGHLSVSPRTLYSGDAVKFTGWLVRGKKNQKAILQIKSNGRWRALDSDYTNRRGKFSFKGTITREPATYRYRVLGKPSRVWGVPQVITRPVTVTVEARPGSQALPWRPSQWFSVEDWRFALNSTVTDAWPVLHSQDQYADPPPPGWTYVAVALGFTRTGPGSGKAWVENDLEFVGGNGVVYSGGEDIGGNYYSCSLDNDWLYAPEVYTGASASGTECVTVPTAAITGGLWRMTGGYDDPQQFITLN